MKRSLFPLSFFFISSLALLATSKKSDYPQADSDKNKIPGQTDDPEGIPFPGKSCEPSVITNSGHLDPENENNCLKMLILGPIVEKQLLPPGVDSSLYTLAKEGSAFYSLQNSRWIEGNKSVDLKVQNLFFFQSTPYPFSLRKIELPAFTEQTSGFLRLVYDRYSTDMPLKSSADISPAVTFSYFEWKAIRPNFPSATVVLIYSPNVQKDGDWSSIFEMSPGLNSIIEPSDDGHFAGILIPGVPPSSLKIESRNGWPVIKEIGEIP